jgi:gliding motility-associated lipoprotein GldD
MRMLFGWILLLFWGLGLSGCVEYTPKPRGFFRIDLPKAQYAEFSPGEIPCSFNVSRFATVELPPLRSKSNSDQWINIAYPDLNVKLYCTYQKIRPSTLPVFENECRELVSRSAQSAITITEQACENPETQVYATLFRVEGGEWVSPIQFMLTDRVRHFFRGALYYPGKPNVDSLAPVTGYLQDDVIELIQSFQWK